MPPPTSTRQLALITGASSGFGLLTTIELARAGFHVVASMRELARRARLDEAAAVASVADRIDIRRLDVIEFEAIQPFVEKLVADYGRLDVLVNNAGFAMAGFAEDMKLDEIRQQFDTNFFGQVAMTQAVLPTMRKLRSGHIIMVSSISGLHGAFAIGSYAASKHALEGWSESLRLEMNTLGVKVVLVEPGSFQTDIWDRNAKLGARLLDGTSANRQRGEKMRECVRELPKKDPLVVAQTIARIAQDPNPKLRYLIGRDARIQLWMKRIFPWKWHEKMVANFLRVDE